MKTDYKLLIEILLKKYKIEFVKEYKFHPTRKWRFDYSIPDKKIAIEYEGGLWINGRHNRASGFIKDMEKYNEAVFLGWKIFRLTDSLITDNFFKRINWLNGYKVQ